MVLPSTLVITIHNSNKTLSTSINKLLFFVPRFYILNRQQHLSEATTLILPPIKLPSPSSQTLSPFRAQPSAASLDSIFMKTTFQKSSEPKNNEPTASVQKPLAGSINSNFSPTSQRSNTHHFSRQSTNRARGRGRQFLRRDVPHGTSNDSSKPGYTKETLRSQSDGIETISLKGTTVKRDNASLISSSYNKHPTAPCIQPEQQQGFSCATSASFGSPNPKNVSKKFPSEPSLALSSPGHNRLPQLKNRSRFLSSVASTSSLDVEVPIESREILLDPLLNESTVRSLYSIRKNFLSPSEKISMWPCNGAYHCNIKWIFQRSDLSEVKLQRALKHALANQYHTTHNDGSVQFTSQGRHSSKDGSQKMALKELMKQLGIPTITELNEVFENLLSQEKGRLRVKITEKTESTNACRFIAKGVDLGEAMDVSISSSTLQEARVKAKAILWKRLSGLISSNVNNSLRSTASSTISSSDKSVLVNTIGNSQDTSTEMSITNTLSAAIKKKLQVNEISYILGRSQSMMDRLGIEEKSSYTMIDQSQICCGIQWTFTDEKGNPKIEEVEASGETKKEALAFARTTLLDQLGVEEAVSSHERVIARNIRTLVLSNDLGSAVQEATSFIESSSSEAWSLFLPELWKSVLASYQLSHVENVVRALDKAGSDVAKPRPLSVTLWESLLDDCCVLHNGRFGSMALSLLTNGSSFDHKDEPTDIRGYSLNLDSSVFPSEKTRRFFQDYRSMLAHEFRAEITHRVAARRQGSNVEIVSTSYGSAVDNHSLEFTVVSVMKPVVKLQTRFDPEIDRFLQQSNMRDGELVLLRPISSEIDHCSSWNKACVVRMNKILIKDNELSVSVRLVTDESLTETLRAPSFMLYPLSTSISQQRMVNALKALCLSKWPASEKRPLMTFSNAMKYILLNSDEETAKDVAQRGDVPNSFLECISHGGPLSQADKKILQRNETRNYSQECPSSDQVDRHLQSPKYESLTSQQRLAVKSALTNRITLIQGPPGTGKTHVACSIIHAWNKINPFHKILVVADSNVAADNLTIGLKLGNIKCIRVGAGSEADLQELCAKEQAIFDSTTYDSEFVKLKAHKTVHFKFISQLVARNQIIITTCIGSGHFLLENYQFSRVVIDECAQSTEPASLVALAKGCSNLVLIGDYQQLPATILSREALARGLAVSLLERLAQSQIANVILLDVQRRMHPSIAEFPNNQTYQGNLKNTDVNDHTRPPIPGFIFPNPAIRVCFIKVQPKKAVGVGETLEGSSKLNKAEAQLIISILRSVLERTNGLSPNDIGPLTSTQGLEIDTIDGFQGKEKELIIFSSVRSNPNGDVGFLNDGRRMNVMLTRARRGLIILGDPETLMQEKKHWRLWLDWATSRQAVIPYEEVKKYLGSSHPDPRRAEDAVSMIMEGRVKNFWPHLFNNDRHSCSTRVETIGMSTKQKSLYVDEEEESEFSDSDEEDWYGDKARVQIKLKEAQNETEMQA